MNYYEHHIGDYIKDTAHLSMVEEAAYRRMIDAYYTRESPLPVDKKACQRLARARSKDECTAVDVILDEYFVLREDGWHQKRCDEEIARFQEKSRKAKQSADARWAKAACDDDANALRTQCEGNATRARPSNQAPVTNTLPSEGSTPATKKANGKSPKRSLPAGFEISDRVRTWAEKKGFDRLEAHFESFIRKCKAKDYQYADWDEGFMGAITDDWARLRNDKATPDYAGAVANLPGD